MASAHGNEEGRYPPQVGPPRLNPNRVSTRAPAGAPGLASETGELANSAGSANRLSTPASAPPRPIPLKTLAK